MAEIVVEAQCEAKMSRARFETRGGFALDCSNENCIDLRMIEVSQLMCSVCVERIGVRTRQRINKQSCLSLGRNELQGVVQLSHTTVAPFMSERVVW